MATAEKALRFYNEANDWFNNAGLPSDLTVVVDGVNFHLHKFPLLSRSGKIEKLIKETQHNDKGICTITLKDIFGGNNGFLVVAKFCYGVHIEFTPKNIVMMYFWADYLEMTDEYGDNNLLSKADNYLHKSVLKNFKDCMVVLQSCETAVTKSVNLQIVDKCLDAVSTIVCTDTGFFGWPMMMYGRLQSPEGSILWNGINTGARFETEESDWWFDDVSHICFALFERLIRIMEVKGIQPEKLTGAIMYYSRNCLHGLGRWQNGQIMRTRSIASFSTKNDPTDQKSLTESIIKLLPQTKGKSICRFLLGLLRVALISGVTKECRDLLEKRIGMQLEFATIDGLMIPSYSDSDTLYDTECVERMINCFFISNQMGNKSSPSSISLRNVSKLVDSYMAEIASDVNLKPEKIISLAEAIPESSRSLNDGLYRALDIYIEAHPWLTEEEKEHVCNIIDSQKLSIDACFHASQNIRLPLRFVLQVLFFERMHLKKALIDCLNGQDDVNNITDPLVIVTRGNRVDDLVSLVCENQILKDDMERMRTRVHQLEDEFNTLRQEIKRLNQI